MPLSVFAPASVGNFSVGFDLLGLAVSSPDRILGDTVTIAAADDNSLALNGAYANILPPDINDNLVWKALEIFNQRLSQKAGVELIVPVNLVLEKNLPICSGLGSSGTSVVASCMALNAFYNTPFTDQEILKIMGACEAGASGSVHYDNIAPTYLGGLRLCHAGSSQTNLLPWPEDWSLVLAYSGVDVPTAQARQALPQAYPRSAVISQMQYLAHFVDALHRNDLNRAAANIQDLIAEPYRARFLPEFDTVTQGLRNQFKVLASGISGSGPTIFALVDKQHDVDGIVDYLASEYCQEGGFVVRANCDRHGARLV
ncbi:MAG: homoserine kinase [Gammaproteobacteria bacterium]|nr:homoserine kinase [Gammaproteobacteria bacterium]NNC98074.1 homoserine kinase [Gammaproteobacteria bacterium]NNM14624.1 homoserine kinase [Gammaproteobacteria bacterium]